MARLLTTVFLFSILVVHTATPALGQAGALGLYADPGGINCQIVPQVGLFPIYAVHVLTPGATAIEFSAPQPACLVGATYLADTAIFPVTIGDSQSGVQIGYGVCMAGPIHVLTIQFFEDGQTDPGSCCIYRVFSLPNAADCELHAVDCNNNLLVAFGAAGLIGNTPECHCTVSGGPARASSYRECPVPVWETTWGQVKSMYGQ